MKKIVFALMLMLSISSMHFSCEKEDSQPDEWECGTYNGNQLYTGPRGGCYYYNSNDNKTYVDRSYCNCK